ncbi:MAG: ABC transporter ATP-binding protein [Nocardioidaceae bacterium]|nr:ABC transporter ATP-binding protein [Nocardioidaceae bacterium]
MSALLDVRGLDLSLPSYDGERPILRQVTFSIGAGESLGLVGESGSGKSMTVRSIAGLLPRGARVGGSIVFDGTELAGCSAAVRRASRSRMALVFQDPRAHINPVRSIGDFLTEALRLNRKVPRREAEARALRVLDDVGVSDPARRLRQYPHELSGGLLQRVMIASALLVEPELLLADEPTTALDVTTQADVMAIIDDLRRDLGLALLFITHDLDLAAAVCDRTAVMYAGEVIEVQPAEELHEHPEHPYTQALTAARPSLTGTSPRLPVTPGRPIAAFQVAGGCPFEPRCAFATDRCREERPSLHEHGHGVVACHHAGALDRGPVRA